MERKEGINPPALQASTTKVARVKNEVKKTEMADYESRLKGNRRTKGKRVNEDGTRPS